MGKSSDEKQRDAAQSSYQNTISDNKLRKETAEKWVFA
jgi:hypothetical protein